MKEKLLDIWRRYYLAVICFAVTFVICLGLIIYLLQRVACIEQIKREIRNFETSLSELNYDFAYENLHFSAINPFSIVKIKKLRIYSLNSEHYYEWSTPELSLRMGIFNSSHMTLDWAKQQIVQIQDKKYPFELGTSNIELDFDSNTGLRQWVIGLENINIKDIAFIEKFKWAARRMSPQQINELSPFFENHIEFEHITLNGLLDYPLSQTISRIYLNANVIGVIKNAGSLRESFVSWMLLGGSLDIKRFVLNWAPLLMVGRGDFYFNEKMEPSLHLNTSSKALFELIDDLNGKGWLESKGVFVAKILLNNKAFKLEAADKYMTVATPIDYRDGKLSVENITLIK